MAWPGPVSAAALVAHQPDPLPALAPHVASAFARFPAVVLAAVLEAE
jgi:hypothetical protein